MRVHKREYLLPFFLVSIFFLDFLGKKLLFMPEIFEWVSKGIRLLFFLYFLKVALGNQDIILRRSLGILTGIFLIGQGLLFFSGKTGVENITGSFRELILYLFPFVFYKYAGGEDTSDKAINTLRTVFEIIIGIVLVSVWIGVLFKVTLFSTYLGGPRFGYIGVLQKSVTATYFFIAAISYGYYFVRFHREKKTLFLVTVATALLTGTKGVYLFLILTGIFHIIHAGWYKKKRFYLFIGILSLVTLVFYKKILDILQYVFYVLYRVYIKDGFWAAVTSYRNQIFYENFSEYSVQWSFWNYLLGGRIQSISIFEMSVVDLTVFFGVGGGLLYLYLLYVNLKLPQSYSGRIFFKFVLAACFFVSIFAGQFFLNISAITYFFCVLIVLQKLSGQEECKEKKMTDKRISLLGTYVDNLTMDETIGRIDNRLKAKDPVHHMAINAAKVVLLQKDKALKESVNDADIINADGLAVVWASRILGKPLKERVAGIDLFINLVEYAHNNKRKVFLLGAKPSVVEAVRDHFIKKYSEEVIAGIADGYFSEQEEDKLVDQIVSSGADMLFVAIASPKKELFLYKHKRALKKVGFIMGVGGSFDVISGKTKRAPLWMQRCGLEWFYRFLQEPRRMWKRSFITNFKFIGLVFKEKWFGRSS